MTTIENVFKNSWGRVCSASALVVAIVQEFRKAELAHVALWLGVATGAYTLTKILSKDASSVEVAK